MQRRLWLVLAGVCFLANPVEAGQVRAKSGAVASVADAAVHAFQCLVNSLEGQGYPIKFMGGYRRHGSVRHSLHPMGLALDINQYARNWTKPRMPSNEISLANACGLISGAQWANGDSGHFQQGGWAGTGRRYAQRSHKRYYARVAKPVHEKIAEARPDGG